MAKKKTTRSKEILKDYVELPTGKLYLLPIAESDIQEINFNTRQEFEKQGKLINPPTYTTDQDETFEWDEKSIEKDGTDEDKAKWEQHQQDLAEFNVQVEGRAMYHTLTESPSKFVTNKGNEVDLSIDEVEGVFNAPEFWLNKQRRLGHNIPDDPYELKFDYMCNLIKGVVLKQEILSTAMSLNIRNMVSDEGVMKYRATFRYSMEQAKQETEEKLNNALRRVNEMVTRREEKEG